MLITEIQNEINKNNEKYRPDFTFYRPDYILCKTIVPDDVIAGTNDVIKSKSLCQSVCIEFHAISLCKDICKYQEIIGISLNKNYSVKFVFYVNRK